MLLHLDHKSSHAGSWFRIALRYTSTYPGESEREGNCKSHVRNLHAVNNGLLLCAQKLIKRVDLMLSVLTSIKTNKARCFVAT